jgi:hypothetical protein
MNSLPAEQNARLIIENQGRNLAFWYLKRFLNADVLSLIKSDFLPLNPALYQFTSSELYSFDTSQRRYIELSEDLANFRLIDNDLRNLINSKDRQISSLFQANKDLRLRLISLTNSQPNPAPTNPINPTPAIEKSFFLSVMDLMEKHPPKLLLVLTALILFVISMSELLNWLDTSFSRSSSKKRIVKKTSFKKKKKINK